MRTAGIVGGMKYKMREVLISTRPKWCEKICHEIGKDKMDKPIYEKRIEVRKSAPKEVPFKCYIYCSKDNANEIMLLKNYKNRFIFGDYRNADGHFYTIANGKVIGEFICDKIDRLQKRGIDNNFDYCYLSLNEWGNDDIAVEITDIKKSCITKADLNKYGVNVQWLYAWHISDLKIYDKPKELSEFYIPCNEKSCRECDAEREYDVCVFERRKPITRPPQSYMYVEELKE